MSEMKKANCRLLIVGYGPGSPEILKTIRKDVTVDDNVRFARDAKRAGLLTHGDFLIGSAGETSETIEFTKQMIRQARPELLQISVASTFLGTEFYDWAKERSFLQVCNPDECLDDECHQKAIISYPNFSSEEIIRPVDSILKDYYVSPGYVPLALKQALRRNGLGERKRLWRSMRMFMKYTQER